MVKCNNCGTDNLDNALFCKECGFKLGDNKELCDKEDTVVCVKCNTHNPKGAIFCKECGTKIDNNDLEQAIQKIDNADGEMQVEVNNDNTLYNTFAGESNKCIEQAQEEMYETKTSQVEGGKDTVTSPIIEEKNGFIHIKTIALIKGLVIVVIGLVIIIIIGALFIAKNKHQEIDSIESEPIEQIEPIVAPVEKVEVVQPIKEETVDEVIQEKSIDEYRADQYSDMVNLKRAILETSLNTKELLYDEESDKFVDKSKTIELTDDDFQFFEYDESMPFADKPGLYYMITIEGIEQYYEYYEYLSRNYTEDVVKELLRERKVIPSIDEESSSERLYIQKIEDSNAIEESSDYYFYVYKNGLNEFEISAYPIGEEDNNYYNIKCSYEDGRLKLDNSIFIRTLSNESKIIVKSYYDDSTELLYSDENINPTSIERGIQINSNLVNARISPDMEGYSLGKLMKGECYSVLSESDGWFKIEFDGQEGYVKSDFCNLINNGTVEEAATVTTDDETICDLARKYYKKTNGEEPPLVSIDSRNGNELEIHLYEIMEYDDNPDETHTSTWGWYWIDSTTLMGTDMFDMPVNLNEVR